MKPGVTSHSRSTAARMRFSKILESSEICDSSCPAAMLPVSVGHPQRLERQDAAESSVGMRQVSWRIGQCWAKGRCVRRAVKNRVLRVGYKYWFARLRFTRCRFETFLMTCHPLWVKFSNELTPLSALQIHANDKIPPKLSNWRH